MADLVENEGFQIGALGASAGAVAVALVVLLVGGGPRRNPWAGLVFAGATVAGLAHQDLLPDDLVTGIALVTIGGVVGDLLVRTEIGARAPLAIQPLVLVPGATFVVFMTEADVPSRVLGPLFVLVLIGAGLAADVDRWTTTGDGPAAGLGPVMLAVTVGGMWATVPETEHAVVLAGAAVPVALLGWPRPIASLSGTGAALVVSLVAWTSVVDGAARHGAVVGGFACLGMFLLGPVLRRLGMRLDPAALLVGHIVLVGLCSRVAGLRSDAGTALVLALLAYGLVGVGTLAWSRRQQA